MNNKRGSVSIFLALILTAMIAVTAGLIYGAKHAAAFSFCDGVLNLSGKSILSEFSLELKQDYGLFAFENSGSSLKRDLAEYIGYALDQNDAAEVGNLRVDTGDYSLGNIRVFKDQILEYMKFAMANSLLEGPKEEAHTQQEEGKSGRTLRNKKIIHGLPSAPLSDSRSVFSQWADSLASRIGNVDEVFRENTKSYLVNRYMIETFKHARESRKEHSTFFEYEVEYILEGNYSDQKNLAGVRRGIVLMRSGLNAAYLYLNSEKRNIILAAAELLTPGPAAAVTQAALTGTWALAEAENDAGLLLQGKPVAFFKSDDSWATDLDSILKGSINGCVDTGCREGLYYKDYLMIFLHVQSEPVKLYRAMDLIQINMKGNYREDFLLQWCSCGLQLKAEISGKERVYDFKY